jgi:oligoendopeptidase F
LYNVEAVSLSAGQVTDAVENALTGARREFKDSFSYMDKYELCYLGYDSRQLSASYTTYIPKYNAPITVILGSGNVSDVLTLAHEFGHFTEGFLNYGIINNIDMSEIPSTTLEYLFLSRIDDSGLGAREIETLKKYKKASSLDLYISQCLYYTFEDRLYSMAEKDLTLDNVNALARDVIKEFGLEDYFEYFDYSWSMIEHFYQQAFYVISYVTADFVSLQIASLEAGKKGDGFKMYLTLINWHDSKTFTEQLEFRSLESPFSDGAAGLLVTNLQKVLGI